MATTSAEAWAEVEAQGALKPGQEGWWQVWGASTHHIRPGDIVGSKLADGTQSWDLIQDTFQAKAAPARVGLVVDGERITLGALVPIVLLRRGNHHTLAD